MKAAGYSQTRMSRETGLSSVTVKSYLRQIEAQAEAGEGAK